MADALPFHSAVSRITDNLVAVVMVFEKLERRSPTMNDLRKPLSAPRAANHHTSTCSQHHKGFNNTLEGARLWPRSI